jgi:hypothetical protein
LDAQERKQHSAISVMRGVLRGLAGLHAAGICHRDLKPDNIMIDSEQQSVIIDFETSKVFRQQAGHQMTACTTTMGAIGTAGYHDLAVIEGRAVGGPYSDMYAFGIIMTELLFGRRMPYREFKAHVAAETDDVDDGVAQVLLNLLHPADFDKRMTARQLLDHPLFALEKGFAQVNRTCLLCMCPYLITQGVTCNNPRNDHGGPHFLCNECLSDYVTSCCQDEKMAKFEDTNCRIFCPKWYEDECFGSCYDDVTLAVNADAKAFQTYQDFRLKVKEKGIASDIQKDADERLQSELARLIKMSEEKRLIYKTRLHIVEQLLNLRCPRNGCVFADFTGCFALTCTCGTAFCGCKLMSCCYIIMFIHIRCVLKFCIVIPCCCS